MDANTITVVACFAGVIIIISFVVITFLCLARRLEKDYLDRLGDKDCLLIKTMDRDTVLERMVRGGRVLQYITILAAFSAVFFLAILGKISAEIAATIIGMIITAVIGAEAGARIPGLSDKNSQPQKPEDNEKP